MHIETSHASVYSAKGLYHLAFQYSLQDFTCQYLVEESVVAPDIDVQQTWEKPEAALETLL